MSTFDPGVTTTAQDPEHAVQLPRPPRAPRPRAGSSEPDGTGHERAGPSRRVRIIGPGFWAGYGHIPALRTLPEFEVVSVSARRQESAQQTAQKFSIPHAYDDAHELIKDPGVDLVAVLTPTSQRVPLVKAAIEAGKDVYSEWPLTTRTSDSEELLALAEAKGVRHVVGLQRRQGPAARYARDLVAQGYVGDVRAARISLGVDAFPPVMPERVAWTFDVDGACPFQATAAGYQEMLAWARSFGDLHHPGVEGTGSYGAALCRYLLSQNVQVIEVNRPDRASLSRRSWFSPAATRRAAALSGPTPSSPGARGCGP
ncbi:Gfo/Idh/MocA family protein [Streptomyces sp. NBC_00271]|uniref:Gfo/Idh/MocA family protein n=1 Tax=Streptomyces sp. NBC_00271 TaxID=2975697 RepID=UPI002E2B3F08|nr:Gfo/Idh/MocA family oxidoreductase [Streptomyces sp. NBC_00271]